MRRSTAEERPEPGCPDAEREERADSGEREDAVEGGGDDERDHPVVVHVDEPVGDGEVRDDGADDPGQVEEEGEEERERDAEDGNEQDDDDEDDDEERHDPVRERADGIPSDVTHARARPVGREHEQERADDERREEGPDGTTPEPDCRVDADGVERPTDLEDRRDDHWYGFHDDSDDATTEKGYARAVSPACDRLDGTVFWRGAVDPAAMVFGVDVPFYDPGTYWLTRFALQRGVAAIYLVAFVVALRQFRPLCGEDGLLPIADYVDRFAFRERPSLLYLSPTDRTAAWLARAGIALSALALLGVPSMLGTPVAVAVWLALWALYLSFANAGQLFYGYGWESMLCEAGALAVFLGGWDVATPAVTVWLFRWLLFRNMLGAGLIKLRGDDCWRDLTCMDYHYETQPMPNPASWFAHHLPERFHRVEVAGNHVVELAVPLLYFAPQPFASIAGAVTVAFMGWLLLTGNFSWLNALTVVLALSLFADPQLAAVAESLAAVATVLAGVDVIAGVPVAAPSNWFTAIAWAYAVVVLALSYHPVRNMLSTGQRMNTSFDPLNLVNTYGAFGHVTKTRYELVVQGTTDEVVDDDTEWETYEFHGKPTDVSRRPPQWAPYHLRLDWQLWFAAMQPLSRNP